MSSKKNILLLIPHLGSGGAELSISKLSVELSKKYTVYLAVFNTNASVVFPFGGTLIDLNVEGGKTMIMKLVNFFKRVKQTRQVKKKFNIHVCISFLEGADYVNILSKNKEKVVLSIRGSKQFDAEIKGKLGVLRKKLFIPLLYKMAEFIIPVSDGIREELINNFNLDFNKIKPINNFYYTEDICEQANELLDEKYSPIFENPVIITSGRLHIAKAQSALLDIFCWLTSKATTKLIILGDGELINELLEKARSLKLLVYWWGQDAPIDNTYQVYFIGYQENPFKFIRRASLFVLTSSWEGFPNALAEAMICGTPVVSTDCPTGPREILAPGTKSNYNLTEAEPTKNGILMPLLNKPNTNNSIQVWVRTLDQLLADAPLRLAYAANARKRMLSFSSENIITRWEQIIENA